MPISREHKNCRSHRAAVHATKVTRLVSVFFLFLFGVLFVVCVFLYSMYAFLCVSLVRLLFHQEKHTKQKHKTNWRFPLTAQVGWAVGKKNDVFFVVSLCVLGCWLVKGYSAFGVKKNTFVFFANFSRIPKIHKKFYITFLRKTAAIFRCRNLQIVTAATPGPRGCASCVRRRPWICWLDFPQSGPPPPKPIVISRVMGPL